LTRLDVFGKSGPLSDTRTIGMQDKAFELVPRREIYDRTGIQFMNFNTVFQLLALKLQRRTCWNELTRCF
jgi:rhamnulokinase